MWRLSEFGSIDLLLAVIGPLIIPHRVTAVHILFLEEGWAQPISGISSVAMARLKMAKPAEPSRLEPS